MGMGFAVDAFVRVDQGRQAALVHPEYREAVSEALLNGAGCEAVETGGRGGMSRFSYDGGTALIRPYRRGGVVRHFLGDVYWFVNRPRRELEVHLEAEARGLSVPKVLGVCWTQSGFRFRGRIATDELDAVDLLEFVRNPSGDHGEVLQQCGRAIREMHDAGILHRDLQVRNILIKEGQPYLIDFDNARTGSVSSLQHGRNLLRLRRSMEKNHVPGQHFEWLCEGYGGQPFTGWLSLLYRVKGYTSDLLAARLPRGRYRAVYLRQGADAVDIQAAVESPGEILKESPKSLTKRVGKLVVKQTRAPGAAGAIRLTLRRKKRIQPWHAAVYLEGQGVGIAKPHAFTERRVSGLTTEFSMVTEFLEGCINVEEYARGLASRGAEPSEIEDFLKALAKSIDGLARTGAYHGDLSGKNVFTADGRIFFFIDLDGVVLNHPYGREARLKNHIQLYDSFCDLWDDEILGAFIGHMVPEGEALDRWLREVREGQRKRRERQVAIWREQGKLQGSA